MRKVKIITDSASGLDKTLAKKFAVEVLPHYVIINRRVLKEGRGIPLSKYYQMLREARELPKTAQVNPNDIEAAFKKFSKDYEKILFITIFSTFVNTFNFGSLVKKDFPAGKIEVFDSQTALGHQGLMVIEAAKMAEAGASIEEIIDSIKNIREKGNLWATLDTTKYLKMGGRIGYPAWLLTNILSLKPVLSLKSSQISFSGFVRSHEAAQKLVLKKIIEHSGKIKSKKIKLFLHDADNQEAVKQIRKSLTENFEVEEEYWTPVSAVVGTHVGPGTWIVCYSFG